MLSYAMFMHIKGYCYKLNETFYAIDITIDITSNQALLNLLNVFLNSD